MNGLYSVHVSLGDGRTGKGSGVIVLRDGIILGGDAFLYYVGSYVVAGQRMKGEIVINQHTPSTGQYPLFKGEEVGVGFSGEISGREILLLGTALVGNASQIFRGTMRRLVDTGGEA